MRKIGLAVLVMLCAAAWSHAEDGLTTIKSAHSVDTTSAPISTFPILAQEVL